MGPSRCYGSKLHGPGGGTSTAQRALVAYVLVEFGDVPDWLLPGQLHFKLRAPPAAAGSAGRKQLLIDAEARVVESAPADAEPG